MFEAAELGRKVSKEDYEAQLPELRAGPARGAARAAQDAASR